MRKVPVVLLITLCLLGLAAGPGPGPGQQSAQAPAKIQPQLADILLGHLDDQVSVIVQTIGDTEAAVAAARARGAEVTQRWSLISGFAANLQARSVLALAARPDIKWISLNGSLQATGRTGGGSGAAVDNSKLATAYPWAAGAVAAWNVGLTGNGIGIAIVDSGIQHSTGAGGTDLGSRVVADVTFNSAALYQADRYGHGTHVAGIAAGNGQTSAGKYIGIAPRANLLNVKFSGDDGSGTESDLISALDWVYQNRSRLQIVNLSVTSSTAESYKTSAVDAAVERLWNSGIVVVVAAGNRGSVADAVQYPPANDPYVITVGALDDMGTTSLADDAQAAWSSRGVTQDGFAKPDLLAPGAHIVSVKACDSCTIMASAPGNKVDAEYFRMGGTSMAAPMVSGSIALLLEGRPALTPDQVKWLLMRTGRTYSGIARGGPTAVDAGAAAAFTGSVEAANSGLAPSGGGSDGSGTGSNIHWLVSIDY